MEEGIDSLHPIGHPINQYVIHPRYDTESLIQQAISCQMLSETDVSKIQLDLLAIFAEQCDKWTRGESSSVPNFCRKTGA